MFSVLQSVVQSDSMLRACQVTAACQTFFSWQLCLNASIYEPYFRNFVLCAIVLSCDHL